MTMNEYLIRTKTGQEIYWYSPRGITAWREAQENGYRVESVRMLRENVIPPKVGDYIGTLVVESNNRP
jgi:hypothetical protein